MAFLMRQISPERWIQDPHDISCKEEINAESLIDLRAENNAVSTWFVGERTEPEIMHAVSAFASEFKQLDKIVIVFLDEEKIESAGINIQCTVGETKISKYAELHRDISQLTTGMLMDLAFLLLKQVDRGQTQIINSEQIALWLVDCINNNELRFRDLHKSLKQALAGKIKKFINKDMIGFENLQVEFQEEIKEQWDLNLRKTNCKYELKCERYNE